MQDAEPRDSGEIGTNGADAQLPSCDGCRVRKLKCSRGMPSCSNCVRLDNLCTYDATRKKPGLKRGIVDELSRRIEILERRLIDCGNKGTAVSPSASADHCTQPTYPENTGNTDGSSAAALISLTQEIRKLSGNILALSQSAALGQSTVFSPTSPQNNYHTCNGKRQRLNVENSHLVTSETSSPAVNEDIGLSSGFLTGDNLEALLDAFFSNVHPWVPHIHIATFRRKMAQPNATTDLSLILHAILVGALRFVDPTRLRISGDRVKRAIEESRSKVMLMSMKDLSLETLQALTIVAFTHIGDGEPLKAWPIVASLTRTVEFLQLSVEDEEGHYDDEGCPKAFLRPKPLRNPANWMEVEERRRVFWNIFILDRICSVTTGWNIGFTADNVSRRLPVNGSYWNTDEPALAPFFGMWDKSAAKIGNSVAFLPAHYPSRGQSSESNGTQYDAVTLANPKLRAPVATAPMDVSTIGAFAYYVESLESLCRINVYFLQQNIDFSNRQEVSNWLTRFKELDLRLVHWKMFLPARWKDPNVIQEETLALDPNMTLAHITHNTSMILLHQRIGYPGRRLKSIKLPNFHSAETCQSAAIETTLSAVKYLAHAPPHMPVSPHFAFCTYVSARVLLVHSRFYRVDLDPQFWTLIECLQEMSRRWSGSQEHEPPLPLPAQFAQHLQYLFEMYRRDHSFSVGVVGPIDDRSPQTLKKEGNPAHDSEASFPHSSGVVECLNPQLSVASAGNFTMPPQLGHSSKATAKGASLAAAVPLTGDGSMTDRASPSNVSETWASNSSKGPDELTNILSTLTDQSFVEMDRVISFNDFNFESM